MEANSHDEEIRAGFRSYDELDAVRHKTPWQVWRDACEWMQARTQLPASPPSVSVDEGPIYQIASSAEGEWQDIDRAHYERVAAFDANRKPSARNKLRIVYQQIYPVCTCIRPEDACQACSHDPTDPAKSAEHALQELADESQRLGLYDAEHARAVVEKVCEWHKLPNGNLKGSCGIEALPSGAGELCPNCVGRIQWPRGTKP
jgi:hypothetical protein